MTAGDALNLSVQRDDEDVVLTWTGTSAPLYRGMRGESPCAMTELQRTADNQAIDAGAAAGAACCFYSVDPAD